MGFPVADITTALEHTSFCFSDALLLLLNGLDEQRTKYDARSRFRRHGLRVVKRIDCKALGAESVVAQYTQRAQEHCGVKMRVLDLGQYAGQTSAACLWLSLAAGLASSSGDVLAQALPGDHQARIQVDKLRAQGVAASMQDNIQRSALGLCAEALRAHFCAGPDAVMLKPSIRSKLFPAFAGIVSSGPARTDALYDKWVAKLGTREYADELVLLALTLELPIHIVVIPYTPKTALAPWAVTSYGSSEVAQDGSRTIYLGNNDVHYVYLAAKSA